jgi:hypothetical protein
MKRPSLITLIVDLVRRTLGLFFLLIAFLGFILPILPGWPFIVPAVILLGRRDPVLRWLHIWMRRGLRVLRRSEKAWVRQIGERLEAEYIRGRDAILPTIIRIERSLPWSQG